MGRELQKKKNRSGLSKVTKKPKSKKKILNNPIIAANWNQDETLTQNYRRLGLTTKLNSTSGGVERTAKSLPQDGSQAPSAAQAAQAPLSIKSKLPTTIQPGEARIVRDPETGEVHVIEEGGAKPNPLNDSLNEVEDEYEGWMETSGHNGTPHDLPTGATGVATQSANPVIQQLEAHAANVGKKAPRKQSEREQEWIERLVAKHGDNYAKMTRDMKLNPMQQSEGDIKRRVRRWRESRGEA